MTWIFSVPHLLVPSFFFRETPTGVTLDLFVYKSHVQRASVPPFILGRLGVTSWTGEEGQAFHCLFFCTCFLSNPSLRDNAPGLHTAKSFLSTSGFSCFDLAVILGPHLTLCRLLWAGKRWPGSVTCVRAGARPGRRGRVWLRCCVAFERWAITRSASSWHWLAWDNTISTEAMGISADLTR